MTLDMNRFLSICRHLLGLLASLRPFPRLWLFTSLCAGLLSGCASLPSHQTEIIDSRRVEFTLARHDTIPVVFENGLDATIDYWAQVYPVIAQDHTAFAYNRPGYGRSEAASTPRDGSHIVEELRQTLRSKGLSPPYVLVGHSMGGLYMQLFARSHPDEVAALVLVDSTHPEQMRGKGAPQTWPMWLRLGFKAMTSGAAQAEFAQVNATGDAVLALPPLTGKPVIILSATHPGRGPDDLIADTQAKRRDILRLHPGAKQVWVDSGHGIPLEQPEVVIAAIREALGH